PPVRRPSPHRGSRVPHRPAPPCDELLWQPLLKQHYLRRARRSKRTLQRFFAANSQEGSAYRQDAAAQISQEIRQPQCACLAADDDALRPCSTRLQSASSGHNPIAQGTTLRIEAAWPGSL